MAPLHIKEWIYCVYGGRYYVCPGDSDGDGYPPPSPLSQLYPPQAPSPPRGGGTRRKIILYPLDKHSYTQTRVFKSQASRELSTTLAILFSSLWPISRPDKLHSCAKYLLIRGYKFLQVLYFCRRSATGSTQSRVFLLPPSMSSAISPASPGRGWHTNGRLIWHKISPLVHHWTRLSALTHI